MKICALIPSYNEAKTIGLLVEKVCHAGLDVVVIDDGSTDQTAQIAQEAGAHVLINKQNRGKGASLKSGFDYALKDCYDAVITMDGDGQHSPQDLAKFIAEAQQPNSDMIIGNRMAFSKNMPPIRWVTNNLMSFLISMICRRNIQDSQCGYRLIKTRVLKKLNLISSNYEIESEMLIEVTKKGFNIQSVPIQTIYAEQVSQINPIVDTFRFFKFLLKLFISSLFKKNES